MTPFKRTLKSMLARFFCKVSKILTCNIRDSSTTQRILNIHRQQPRFFRSRDINTFDWVESGGPATYISCAPMSIPQRSAPTAPIYEPVFSFCLAIIVSLCAGERGPRRESLQSPNRDRCTLLQVSSLTCPPPRTHAFRRARQAPMLITSFSFCGCASAMRSKR